MKGSCLAKRMNFFVYFVPWIIVLVAIVTLDVLATVFYSIDSFNILVNNFIILY